MLDLLKFKVASAFCNLSKSSANTPYPPIALNSKPFLKYAEVLTINSSGLSPSLTRSLCNLCALSHDYLSNVLQNDFHASDIFYFLFFIFLCLFFSFFAACYIFLFISASFSIFSCSYLFSSASLRLFS